MRTRKFDITKLQTHLLNDCLSQPDQSVATISGTTTRNSRSGRNRNNNRDEENVAVVSRGLEAVNDNGLHHEETNLSFLPSTVPESLPPDNQPGTLSVVRLTMDVEDGETGGDYGLKSLDDQDDKTQEMSPSVYEDHLREIHSRKGSSGIRDLPDDCQERSQDGTDQNETRQHTLREGDSNYLDFASSFDVAAVKPVTSSPTQTQCQLSQFPESQRFMAKTPATAGKKRDHAGNVIDTPVISRNPFARNTGDPGVLMGLSQAFDNTQAASSPFLNGLPSELRSDMPSPGIEQEKHVQRPTTSSPTLIPSSNKRAATEPAARYIPLSQSQHRRESSIERSTTRETYDALWDGEIPTIQQKRKRGTNPRARGHLHPTASLTSSRNRLTLETERRIQTEKPNLAPTDSTSPPSSPPAITSRIVPEDEECDLEPTQSQYVTYESVHDPMLGYVGTLQSAHDDSDIVNMDHDIIPETNVRPSRTDVQTLPSTQASPSKRTRRAVRLVADSEANSSGRVRIRNSQRSKQSTQEPLTHLPAISSLESIDVVPASPEYQIARPEDKVHAKIKTRERVGTAIGTLTNFKSSTSSQPSAPHQPNESYRLDDYSAMPGRPSPVILRNPEFSSQPIRTGQRRRKKMEDISQEVPIHSNTQNSNIDVMEIVISLDDDPEAAELMASTPDHFTVSESNQSHNRVLAPPFEDTALVIQTNNLNTVQEIRQLSRTKDSDANELKSGTGEHSDGEENSTLRDDDPQTMNEETSTNQSPGQSRRRRSIWLLGESPKARFVPEPRRYRVHTPAESLQRRATKRSRQRQSTDRLATLNTLPSIEEASPGPSTISTATVAQSSKFQSMEKVTAPTMVLVAFFDGKTKYYPAKYIDKTVEDRFLIKWSGYDVESIPSHGVCSLDLRVRDEVNVELRSFPNGSFLITGFQFAEEASENSEAVTDIYGHSHVFIQPKSDKVSFPENFEKDTPIPINDISINMIQWRKTSKRAHVYRTSLAVPSTSGYSTPPIRASTPATPSSRGRNVTKKELIQSFVQNDGIFSNMAFALSYDEDLRKKYTKLILENGGDILDNGFQDLFNNDNELAAQYASYGFAATLSNMHSARPKFLQALALGLPCLSGKWIEASLENGGEEPWQDYLLPAGESLDLDKAVKSRILNLPDCTGFKLAETLKSRKRYFEGCLVISVRPRKDERPYLFLTQFMSAVEVKEVADLKAAKDTLLEAGGDLSTWIVVEKGGAVAAERLIQDLLHKSEGKWKRKRKEKSKPIGSTDMDIRVIDNETIKQTLIMGRLSVHNQPA